MKAEKADRLEGHRFPLDLVANIAARLLVGETPRGDREQRFKRAADSAVSLLYACEARLSLNEEVVAKLLQDQQTELVEQAEICKLARKHPKGVPWQRGLYIITGLSAADAKLPYKLWCVFERFEPTPPHNEKAKALQAQLPGAWITEDHLREANVSQARFYRKVLTEQGKVDAQLETIVSSGFPVREIIQARFFFREWYRVRGVSIQRSEAGKKGAMVKAAKKRLAQSEGRLK